MWPRETSTFIFIREALRSGRPPESMLLRGITRLFDAMDKSLRGASEVEKNPPKPPDKMPDAVILEKRPVGIGGEPILF